MATHHRLLILNFEGVITTNTDPYTLFFERAAELGIDAGRDLQKERLSHPNKNLLPNFSRLMESICRKSGMELQAISEQFALDTQIFPGIETLFENVERDETIDVLIISDFNNVMLEQTLAAKKIAVGRTGIVTNSLRLLSYGQYEPVLRSRMAVKCEYCPSNLCKGMELRTHLREAEHKGIRYSLMILMGSLRSDVCVARLLRQKDFVCAPLGSELAHILTKISTIERIMGRALRNANIAVKIKHTILYSDPKFVLRLLHGGTVDSTKFVNGFITLLDEKRARLRGVPLDMLPSSKLQRISEMDEKPFGCDIEETEGVLKVSPPFMVGTIIGCSSRRRSLSSKKVDSQMLNSVIGSPRITSLMTCIQNIVDALDYFKKGNSTQIKETLISHEATNDYFCRRRGPNDMPREYSTPYVHKNGDVSEEENEDRRACLFLPFSRSHTEPIPASQVEISTPTSIWNESYKCQELPPLSGYRPRIRSEAKMFTEMDKTPKQQLCSEQSLHKDASVESAIFKQSPTSPVSAKDVWPYVSRTRQLSAADSTTRVSGKLTESSTTRDDEKGAVVAASEIARHRTSSVPGNSVRKPSRVRSSGKIVSESLFRDRVINQDIIEFPRDSVGDGLVHFPRILETQSLVDGQDPRCGNMDSVDLASKKSELHQDHTKKDDSFDLLVKCVEKDINAAVHDKAASCLKLPGRLDEPHQCLVDVYEPLEFGPTTKLSYAEGDCLRAETTIGNSYGVISLISGKVYGSQEIIPSLCMAKGLVASGDMREAEERHRISDIEMSYENVVVGRCESSLDGSWCSIEGGDNHPSSLEVNGRNVSNIAEYDYENVQLPV